MYTVTEAIVTDGPVLAAHRTTITHLVPTDPGEVMADILLGYMRAGWTVAAPAMLSPHPSVSLRQWVNDLPIARVTISAREVRP